jgi:large subunit ribosomal protein L7/L12
MADTAKLQGILDQIKELTLLEAAELVKMMEEAFGVSAAAAAVPRRRRRPRPLLSGGASSTLSSPFDAA